MKANLTLRIEAGDNKTNFLYNFQSILVKVTGEIDSPPKIKILGITVPYSLIKLFQSRRKSSKKRNKKTRSPVIKKIKEFIEIKYPVQIDFSTETPDVDYPVSVILGLAGKKIASSTSSPENPFLELKTYGEVKLTTLIRQLIITQ